MRRFAALLVLLPGLAFAAPIAPPSPVTADANGDALVAKQFIASTGLVATGVGTAPAYSVLIASNCWYNSSAFCLVNSAGGALTAGYDFFMTNYTSSPIATITRQGVWAGSGATVAGAGTTQATATAISTQNNIVSACAAGAGVRLVAPSIDGGMPMVWVYNTSANACLIYPQTGASIFQSGVLTANASYSCAAYADCHFTYISSTEWLP